MNAAFPIYSLLFVSERQQSIPHLTELYGITTYQISSASCLIYSQPYFLLAILASDLISGRSGFSISLGTA